MILHNLEGQCYTTSLLLLSTYTACLHTRAVYRGVNEMGQIM